MQRPQRGAAHWLAPHGLLNLLSYSTQDYQPRGVPTHSELGPLPSIINQENALQACPQANLVGVFAQLRFPLPKGL